MKPRIEELFQIIKVANDELEQIRKDCPHPSWSVGRWEWAPGHGNVTRICDECSSPVDGTTDDEIKEYTGVTVSGITWVSMDIERDKDQWVLRNPLATET